MVPRSAVSSTFPSWLTDKCLLEVDSTLSASLFLQGDLERLRGAFLLLLRSQHGSYGTVVSSKFPIMTILVLGGSVRLCFCSDLLHISPDSLQRLWVSVSWEVQLQTEELKGPGTKFILPIKCFINPQIYSVQQYKQHHIHIAQQYTRNLHSEL